jgi:(p)ppGpp synthase/HD superfamily hydrolase
MYAQTNIQLYSQLIRSKCTPDGMRFIRRAYELAVRLFAGMYRPSGKSFLDHVIGTASTLHKIKAKPALTAAGLLHSAYIHRDFGLAGRISVSMNSQRLTETADAEVEDYVRMYTEYNRLMRHSDELEQRIDDMSMAEREVILMHVANTLEDHLDGGTLYCHNAAKHRDKLAARGELLSRLACKLGSKNLQREIGRVFAECASQPLAPELLQRMAKLVSYRILPESCRRSS